MEEKPCNYNKYGYCKFRDLCRKKHFKEVCQNHNTCDNKNECNKRHPKTCKNFITDKSCRFKDSCAYFHPEQSESDKNKNNMITDMQVKIESLERNMKEKVDLLEITTKVLSEKVQMLEAKLVILLGAKDKSVKEMSSERNINKSESKEVTNPRIKAKLFECDQCDFSYKRKKSLIKHMNTKHHKERIQCKECKQYFDSKNDMINHVKAKHSSSAREDKTKLETSESNDSDSESDTLEPYICMECGNKYDEWEDFRDHLTGVHEFPI